MTFIQFLLAITINLLTQAMPVGLAIYLAIKFAIRPLVRALQPPKKIEE
jgi:hypothetical protein